MSDSVDESQSDASQRTGLDAFLHLIDLRCTVYHNQQLCGDWELAEHEVGQTCFHLVSHGQCELSWAGETWQLGAGDLVLFPAEEPHRLRTLEKTDAPMRTLTPAGEWATDHTGLLCASVTFAHRASRALLDALPKMTLLRRDDHNDSWLTPLLQQVVWESQHPAPGQSAVLDQLAELIFMQSIRHHQADQARPAGLLGLLSDERLSRAVDRFHANPARAWTLAELAQQSAMSRSQFAARFHQVSGWTPARYMTWWRMQQAWHQLAAGDSVMTVALAVGYQSEAAFSRAFRQAFDVTAGSVRRQKHLKG